jgi:hypothetical protein
MELSIQTEFPREPAGGNSRVWRVLIPTVETDQAPQKSIYDVRMKGNSIPSLAKSNNIRVRDLRILFSTHMGLGDKVSSILASRPLKQLYRIEKTWHSIIDCFFVYDTDFIKRNCLYFRYLCRKVFSTGCFNLDFVIDDFKIFMNWIHIESSKLIIRGDHRPLPNSIFKSMIYKTDLNITPANKLEYERLCAMTLTRGLPSKSDQTKSIQNFVNLVQSEHKLDNDLVDSLCDSAYHIGKRCSNKKPYSGVWHFSVNTAGSLLNSVSEGGKVKEMMDDIRPILESIPDEDREFETPFGLIREEAGIPRWITWYRNPEEFYTLIGAEFPGPSFKIDELGIQGVKAFDASFAHQVYYIAYGFVRDCVYSEIPMEVRVQAVPEPGGKIRTISMGPWWSQVYLAPFGHYFQECLRGDYDGTPSLHRGNLAWDAFINMRNVSHQEGHFWLSSDMTSCTDAFPKGLAFAMLNSFIKGLGIINSSELLDLAVFHCCSQRTALVEGYNPFLMIRGILMGEPMTKSLLTLFMVSVRNYSIQKFRRSGIPLWYFFHIGGDDHLVHGPPRYLDLVMNIIEQSGFIIDHNKQGYTDFACRYLQVPFFFRNADLKNWNKVFKEDTYYETAFCDVVKSRLLSPDTKPHQSQNELNVAIGKAIQLGNCFAYYNESDFQYLKSIRSRFFWRMGRLLPSRKTPSETSIYNVMMLPQILGGLGLALSDEERLSSLLKSPKPTRILVSRLLDGPAEEFELMMHKKLCSNSKYYMPSDQFITVYRYICMLPSVDFKSTPESQMGWTATHALGQLALRGICPPEILVDRILRLQLVLDSLKQVPQRNEIPWKSKYFNLWREYLDELKIDDYPIRDPQSWDEVNRAIGSFRLSRLVDSSVDYEVFTIQRESSFPGEPFEIDIIPGGFMDLISMSMPELKVHIRLDL